MTQSALQSYLQLCRDTTSETKLLLPRCAPWCAAGPAGRPAQQLRDQAVPSGTTRRVPMVRQRNPWVYRGHNSQPLPDAALRLFAIPYAGTGAHVYHSWQSENLGGVEASANMPLARAPAPAPAEATEAPPRYCTVDSDH